jgi:MFS family permease
MLFLSFLFAMLGFRDEFGGIIIVSLWISFGLAFIRPVISGLVSDYTLPGDAGKITGVQQFVVGLGAAFGSILFGLLSVLFGMWASFIIIGIVLFIFALYGIVRKFHLMKK